MEPDLLVELDPDAINGKGYMNLNIRITNNGLLPIDLGQTEIKYYYTNDKGLPQSVAGNYIGGRIDNNYIGITDKSVVEAVKMDVRKNMADTYVSIKFAEDTGVLYFEDYIDLNVQVYNTDWKSGDYILENYHSYQEDEQELQTFSAMARAVSNTTGIREAKNIVVGTRYKTSWLEDWWLGLFGLEPIKYQPTYSAFKVGEGVAKDYKIGDYNAFIDVFEDEFGGKPYNQYAVGENIINTPLNFGDENLKAILRSEIAYISGHGFDGGVITIYHTAFTASCSQLSDVKGGFSDQEDITKSSLDRWKDVLINNSEMKGILGYYYIAPTVDDPWINDDVVIKDFLNTSAYLSDGYENSIYASWLSANTNWDTIRRQKAGLLVKAGYENDTLYASLCDNSDVKCSSIYLYKFTTGLGIWSIAKEEYSVENSSHSGQHRSMAIQAVNEYIGDDSSYVSDDTYVAISEVTRDVYNYSGDLVGNELVDYVFTFEPQKSSISTFNMMSENNDDSSIRIKYNVETSSVSIID